MTKIATQLPLHPYTVVRQAGSGRNLKHLISDQGSQLIAQEFQEGMEELGISTRFGAIGKSGSIALLERLWRSLKGELALRKFKPLMQRDLEERLRLGLHHHAHHRPHQGLRGATPAEIYYGEKPAHLSASSPPRGLPGDGPAELHLEILYLDEDHRLPLLVDKAA